MSFHFTQKEIHPNLSYNKIMEENTKAAELLHESTL